LIEQTVAMSMKKRKALDRFPSKATAQPREEYDSSTDLARAVPQQFFPFPEVLSYRRTPRHQPPEPPEELNLERDFVPEQDHTEVPPSPPKRLEKRVVFQWEPAKILKQRYGV
jgi:hypothetical protein